MVSAAVTVGVPVVAVTVAAVGVMVSGAVTVAVPAVAVTVAAVGDTVTFELTDTVGVPAVAVMVALPGISCPRVNGSSSGRAITDSCLFALQQCDGHA